MDIKKIEKLISLIEKSSINEIEIKEGDTAIRISGNQSKNFISESKTQHIAPIPISLKIPEEKTLATTIFVLKNCICMASA